METYKGHRLGVAVGMAIVAMVGCASKSESGDAGNVGGSGGVGASGSGGTAGAGGSVGGSGSSASSGGSSTGAGNGGSSGGAGGPAADCYARVAHVSGPLEDPADGYHFAAFELTRDGAVGVLTGVDGDGYRMIELDAHGEPRGGIETLWQPYRVGESLQIAVSGDVLALADVAQEGDYQRSVCRLALAELGGVESITEPTRVSDEPPGETILNEVRSCDVTRAGDGFLVVWEQVVSDTSGESSLFAQRFDAEGTSLGDRLTLATGDKFEAQVTLASDGDAALVARLVDETIEITFIGPDDERKVVVDGAATLLQSPPQVAAVSDGLLLQGADQLVLIDRDGQRLAGPVDTSARLVAPLDDGYVLVESEEFLVARTLDSALGQPSEASGLSTDRRARGSDLLFTPDGDRVALVYNEGGHQHFATLECSSEPAPLGPQPCREADAVEPLDLGCDDAVCHVLVRLDAQTLGVRGYAVVGGDEDPIDANDALARAGDVFALQGDVLADNAGISGPEAGIFMAYAEPADFGAFALVSADSGLVLAAGGVIWSGTGYYWTPETWQPASDLACGSDPTEPDDSYVGAGDCGLDSPDAALDVVLRSNLAADLAQRGPFAAYGYLYTPTVGACDPAVAEYLVVLSQHLE